MSTIRNLYAQSSTIVYTQSIMATSSQRPRKALIIGAGPVGSLAALSLHRRGWEVEIWEGREGESCTHRCATRKSSLSNIVDPRGQSAAITNLRSINLALSARGLAALRSVDPSLGWFS